MKGKTNNDVLGLMNEFLSPIRMEKAASDEINELKKTNSAEPVVPEVDKGDGTAQGSFGAEKQKDATAGAEGVIAATSPEATNNAGGSDKPTDDQGTKSIGSDEKLSQPSVTVNTTADPADDNAANDKGQTGGHDKAAKMKRNSYLAQNINALLQKKASDEAAAAAPVAAAPVAAAPEAAPIEKAASEEDIFKMAFQRGIEKRAEDEAELVAAGMNPEEAAATLDTVADANPMAVLPEEAEAAPEMGEMPAEMAPEGMPELPPEIAPEGIAPEAGPEGMGSPEELAAALDEAGVTAEELAEAVETVKGLEEAGVAPEEIVAAVQNAAGEAPIPEDKVAAARQGVIQGHLGLLKANQ